MITTDGRNISIGVCLKCIHLTTCTCNSNDDMFQLTPEEFAEDGALANEGLEDYARLLRAEDADE